MNPYTFNLAAIDAVNEYTRSLMYHRFTGMPKRGFMARVFPPMPVFLISEMVVRGWRYDPTNVVEFEGVPVIAHLGETGVLFYEVAEERLTQEDFERRLARRQVSRWEWHDREHWRRRIARDNVDRPDPRAVLTYEEKQKYFYVVMGQIVGQVLDIAAAK